MNTKDILKRALLLLLILPWLASCSFFKLEEVQDPNNPSVGSVSQNATRNQIQSLVTGLEVRHRAYVTTVTQAFNSFGREIWYLNGSDPRFQSDWLGLGGRQPDVSFFGFGNTGGAAYAFPYQAIAQANVLIDATNNTNVFNATEKNAIIGFARTIQAYQYMIVAMGQYQNGIRIDVRDQLNPGPFVPYNEALTAIKAILDQGAQELAQGGNTFPVTLTSGFAGFNTPATLRQMNRGIAARLAIYRQDWQGAIQALGESFMNMSGSMNAGPAHTYGAPPDAFNPLFYVLDAPLNTLIVVHPSLISDALPGDTRVTNKFFRRTTPLLNSTDGRSFLGEYQDRRWATNVSPIPFIKNEELILISAEAQAQAGNSAAAVQAINAVRAAAGLAAYSGPTNRDALINEVLFQRRYSLWCEPWGHRWVDMRRYNRLNQIPVALDQGTIFTQLARPQAEINWDNR